MIKNSKKVSLEFVLSELRTLWGKGYATKNAIAKHFGLSVSWYDRFRKKHPEIQRLFEEIFIESPVRVCKVCGESKPKIEYPLNPGNLCGIRWDCVECYKGSHADRYTKNKHVIDRNNKLWYESNRNKRLLTIANYQTKNKERYAKRKRERMSADPLFNLKIKLRDRTTKAFSAKSWKKNQGTEKLLGASYDVVKKHLEQLFEQGMSWDNHGEWHIDHKIPLASANSIEELNELCHYTNLQPLWAHENLSKGSKIKVA